MVDRQQEQQERDQQKDYYRFHPGGTRGGIGQFLFGLALSIAGGYLIMHQVQITSGYWNWFGDNTFGLTLLPLLIGVGLLFFNGKSIPGWILAGGGCVIIFVGILTNLSMYFRTTSLYNVLLMFILFVAGLGLMARSLKHY